MMKQLKLKKVHEEVHLVQDKYINDLWYALVYHNGKLICSIPTKKSYIKHKQEMEQKFNNLLKTTAN